MLRVEPASAVLTCRLVCKTWLAMIDSGRFWEKRYARAGRKRTLSELRRPPVELAAILENSSAFGANLVLNGDCDLPSYALREFKFPHWSNVGNCQTNWHQADFEAADIAALGDDGSSKKCFRAPLTYGPNEMHQKVWYCAQMLNDGGWCMHAALTNLISASRDLDWTAIS